MLKKLKSRLKDIKFIKKAIEEPIDMEIFKKKPSRKFITGLFLIGFSYIIAWPLISLLGIIALVTKKPLIFVIGSPVSYGISHLVFLLGVFIAGKDAIKYMNVFMQWSIGRLCKKFLN